MARLGGLRTTVTLLAVVAISNLFCAAQKTRYFKAECETAADYLKLDADGQYTVIAREHIGIFVQDKGR